jgi:hypothetical protein
MFVYMGYTVSVLGKLFKAAATYALGAYATDVIVKPKQVASLARSYCDRVGKPLLNIGAGTPATSVRALVLGPTLWGDVNIDKAGARVPHGRNNVSYGDAYDLREWPDQHFGAVIASHVLEHLERPDLALLEWRRAAEKVFVVVPPWYTPHAWLHPGHRWYISQDLKTAWPVWTTTDNIVLLPVQGPTYSPTPWAQRNPQQPPSTSTGPSSQALSQAQPSSSTTSALPSESSGSVKTLMVVSSEKSRTS